MISNEIEHPAPVLIPPPLKPGDAVGIVALSSPVDEELLSRGTSFLEGLGLQVTLGCNVLERNGYLAGTDEQRCMDLNQMLRDPLIRGIVCARGGYGVMRLLESADRAAIRNDPKIILGMSDVTALQLSLFTSCRLVTLSGPMPAGQVASEPEELSLERLLTALTRPLYGMNLFAGIEEDLRTHRPGRARGTILGGCLSLVTALLGTPHSPDYGGSILLLEEVNEPLYRIDRMLVQLKLAGVLDSVNAVLLGYFLGPSGADTALDVGRLITELTEPRAVPVIGGFPYGHKVPNVTVPHGMDAELDTYRPKLVLTGEADRFMKAVADMASR
ncbi:MAG: LD-carboxypeptidase [Pseudomonadota bacterium]